MICEYDIKHDLNAVHFKTSSLTYYDSANRCRVDIGHNTNIITAMRQKSDCAYQNSYTVLRCR